MSINVKNVGILLKNSNPLQQIPLKNAKYYSTDNRNSSYKSEKKRLAAPSIEGQEKKEISKKPDSKIKENIKENKDREVSVK
jgi:hypothetical protein